jgi:hypothetical protein
LNQKEFDLLFSECCKSILSKKIETVQSDLEKFVSGDQKISSKQLAAFILTESLNINKEILYSVLSKVIVKD